jgi:hypothetical protein
VTCWRRSSSRHRWCRTGGRFWELKRRRHVTLLLLSLEFRANHPDRLSYSQFCRPYRQWLEAQDVVMRLECRGGKRQIHQGVRGATGPSDSVAVLKAPSSPPASRAARDTLAEGANHP